MKKKVTVTTADVARRAGLSKMTVSRVLNDHPYVSSETRQRVMKAVEELGFTPNTLAKRFFTGKTQLIGMIMPVEYMFSSYYFKDLFRGVMECLEERNFDLLLHDSKSRRIAPMDKARALVKGRLVDGLLVVAPMSYDEYPATLTEEGIPMVVMGETLHAARVFRVGINNRKSTADAVSHLVELGHRNIGMLTFDGGHIEAYQRTRGYQDALKKAGIATSRIGVGHYQKREAYEETLRLLEEHPEITALFAANAEMTMGVLDALKHLQKKIPGDISLIAFDDCEEWEQYSPPISAIRQDPYKIGTEAARMLTDILESKTQQKPTQKMIPTEYIERASVAPPRNG